MIAGLCWSDSMKSILGRSLGFVEFDFDKVDPWLNFSEFSCSYFLSPAKQRQCEGVTSSELSNSFTLVQHNYGRQSTAH